MVLAKPSTASSTQRCINESSDHAGECESSMKVGPEVKAEENKETKVREVATDAKAMLSASDELLALLRSEIKAIRELINCKICYSPLYEPYTTSCGHTFCYGCLCKTFDPDRSKNCPECRTVLDTAPAPAFTLREITHRLIKHPELLGEDETVEGHEAMVKEHDILVKDDRNTVTGLFKGLFADTQSLCPYCDGEVVYGICTYCGYRTDLESDSSTQDSDVMSQRTASDENDEDFDMEDVDHGFDGELPGDAYADDSEDETGVNSRRFQPTAPRNGPSNLPSRPMPDQTAVADFSNPRFGRQRHRAAWQGPTLSHSDLIESHTDGTSEEDGETDDEIDDSEFSDDSEEADSDDSSETERSDTEHESDLSSDADYSTASDQARGRSRSTSSTDRETSVSDDAPDALAQSVARVLDNVEQHLADTLPGQDPTTQFSPYSSGSGTSSRRRQRESTPSSTIGQARQRRRVSSHQRVNNADSADHELEPVQSPQASSVGPSLIQQAPSQGSSQEEPSDNSRSCYDVDDDSDSADTTIGVEHDLSNIIAPQSTSIVDDDDSPTLVGTSVPVNDRGSGSNGRTVSRPSQRVAGVASQMPSSQSPTYSISPTSSHQLEGDRTNHTSSSTLTRRHHSHNAGHQHTRHTHLTRSQSSQSSVASRIANRSPRRLLDHLALRNAADRLALIEAQRVSTSDTHSTRNTSNPGYGTQLSSSISSIGLTSPSTEAVVLDDVAHDQSPSGAPPRLYTPAHSGNNTSRGSVARRMATSSSVSNGNNTTAARLHSSPQQRPSSNNPFMRFLADGPDVQVRSQYASPSARTLREDHVPALRSTTRINHSTSSQPRQLNHTPSMIRLPQSPEVQRVGRTATVPPRIATHVGHVRSSPGQLQEAMNRRITNAMNARAALIASRQDPTGSTDNISASRRATSQQAIRSASNNPFRMPRMASSTQTQLQGDETAGTSRSIAATRSNREWPQHANAARNSVSVRGHFSPFSSARHSRLAAEHADQPSARRDRSRSRHEANHEADSTSFTPASTLHGTPQARSTSDRQNDPNHTLSFLRMSLSGSGFPYT